MSEFPAVDLLYQALASESGIEVETSSPDRLRQKLYAERRKAEDPDLNSLSFVISPTHPTTHLWIIRKTQT